MWCASMAMSSWSAMDTGSMAHSIAPCAPSSYAAPLPSADISLNVITAGAKNRHITRAATGTVPNVTVPPKPPGSPIDSEKSCPHRTSMRFPPYRTNSAPSSFRIPVCSIRSSFIPRPRVFWTSVATPSILGPSSAVWRCSTRLVLRRNLGRTAPASPASPLPPARRRLGPGWLALGPVPTGLLPAGAGLVAALSPTLPGATRVPL
jgi:hypothetical protein